MEGFRNDAKELSGSAQEEVSKEKKSRKINKGKWVTYASSSSREGLQKLFQRERYPFEIQDDGTILNTHDGRILYDRIRVSNGRWQYGSYEALSDIGLRIDSVLKENPDFAKTIEQLGGQVVKGRDRIYFSADAERLQKINDYLDAEQEKIKESQSKPSKPSAREEANSNASISAMNAALRESSEKIINDAAKNSDVARALEQLGAKIKNGKVTYPDDETFQACVNLVNSGIVKSSKRGNTDTAIENFVAPEDLNPLQKAYADFAKEMGVPIVFFRGKKNFHGAHANGISFYNVDATFSHEFVYWHEFGHWLKNNQPQLFQEMLDAVNITAEQIAEKKKSRPDLTDDELKEEIICDAMSDVARRTGLLNQIGKKNSSLIQRIISWAKTTLDRFTDWFNRKERGLTNAQRDRMKDVFGKGVRQITDGNGNKIFRYNNRTHEIELADGRKLPTVQNSAKPKYSTDAETKKAATEGVNPKADNKRITQKARELLKAVGLENRRPKSEEKLGKVYGQMESDGTFTAKIKLKDAEKLEHLKSMADEIGATYNEDTKTFHFDDIESVAVFFKAARTAFHDKTSSQNNYDRQVSGTAGVELPEGYRTETGKPLQESNVRDFVVNEDGDKDFGEITPEIERETNGLVKAAPIRLQVGNGDFGYIHINIRHLQDIKHKGFNDAISYINNILQNIERIYISAETGSLNRFLLCSNGARGHSDNFMPIDLELEQGEDGYYRIVTAYPKSAKSVEGILLFEDSTHSSSVAATDSLLRLTDDKSGVSNHRANAKSNIPSGESIPQEERDSKPNTASDEEYLQAVNDFKNAKTDEQRRSTFRKLQDMVQRAAEAAGFTNAIPEQTVAYKVRTGAAPKKTIKVYKVFTVANDGSPTALFVGGTEKLPQGVWLDAQDAYHFKAKNGKYYVPSTQNPFTKGGKTGASVEIPDEATRQELIKRGFLSKGSKATKITALAYRPGWHAGTLPFFPQGGVKPKSGTTSAYPNIHRYNQVVFECELAAEKNFTAEAEAQPKARTKDGKLNTREADLQYMPENGFYYYATNPMTHGHPELGMWAISGSLKINRALTQEECDKILADNNMAPQEWEQGKMNLADLGYTGEQNDAARKTVAPITYDDNSEVIPLSQRFDASRNDIRYSLDASDNGNENIFRRAWNKLSKALHLKVDKIVTEETKRREKLQAQEKAMADYLKEPTKENKQRLEKLGVTKAQLDAYMKGEEYVTEIGLIQNYRSSPSRIAEKVAVFRAFFRMGDRAMDKLVKLRDRFARKYDEALSFVKSKADREELVQLLWDGDEEQKEFGKLTDAELSKIKADNPNDTTKAIQRAKAEKICKTADVSENVAKAYLAIRRQLERAYIMLDEARRRPQNKAAYLTDKQYEKLRDNKFVKQGTLKIHDTQDEDGKHLVTWTEYANRERKLIVDGSAAARFLSDDAIQILGERELEDGTYELEIREGIPPLNKLTGYVPHFFHQFTAVVRDADGKQVGDIIGTGKTQREAIKLAEQWQKNHQLKDGEQIYVMPHTFNFGMSENSAPVMGDKDFEVMMNRIAQNTGLTLAEAKQIVNGAVKLKNRHRFLGQLLHRKGYKGYENDMDWVLRHHFNTVARYVALETEFKPKAISLFERVFGAFDKDHSKNLLAQYTKDFINDVNGTPAWIDEVINKTLNQNSIWRKYFLPNVGERGGQRIANSLAGRIAYLKLGMGNISSALINFTQLINASGYVGWQPLMKHFGKVLARGGKLTQDELRILNGSGVLQDIGLDTASGYDKNRGTGSDLPVLKQLDWLGMKSMIPFQKCDEICRISTALAAYEKAIAEGKTQKQALDYAKKVNRDANFSYGVEDAPNIMRRTSSVGKIGFQFYKYPLKQLEVIEDFLPQSKKTTFKQKAAFWIPYFFICGLVGFLPFFDWGDKFLNEKFKLFPKDFLQKLVIEGTQEIFGKDSDAGKLVGKVIMYGAPALANVDISKRTGLASIMPQDFESFLLGATGSTIWNTSKDVATGNYANALRDFSPGLFNIYAATIAGETRDARGRKVSAYEDMHDRIVRGMGFKSVDESLATDIQRINFNERDENKKLEQRAIDAYIKDPSPENLQRLKELKISAKRVKEERGKKNLTRLERFEQNMTKNERKRNQYLLDFAR